MAKTTKSEPQKKKTSMGLEENVAGLLCYLGAIITGLIFYFGEKENKFVRFHALQSILVSVVVIVIQIIVGIIGGLLWATGIWFVWNVISILISLACLVLWIFLMVQAYQGNKFKLPIIGNICEKQ